MNPGISEPRIFEKVQKMKLLYKFETRIGTFYIGQQDGRYHPVFDNESLGSYSKDWQAAEDLAGGHTFSISSCIDTSTLGIPADLEEWEALHIEVKCERF